MEQSRSVRSLTDIVVDSVHRARAFEIPFYRLTLDRIFPEAFYATMLGAMPPASD